MRLYHSADLLAATAFPTKSQFFRLCGAPHKRKNWLFADTPQGAGAAATLFSLIETCKYHQIEPYTYLKMVLEKIPACQSQADYRQLLPFNLKIPST
jgi:hypothetical protein